MSETCSFGTFLDEVIRDRFVSGIRTEEIQQKLMTEEDSTFAQVFELNGKLESLLNYM